MFFVIFFRHFHHDAVTAFAGVTAACAVSIYIYYQSEILRPVII